MPWFCWVPANTTPEPQKTVRLVGNRVAGVDYGKNAFPFRVSMLFNALRQAFRRQQPSPVR
jgi:hypothetical protein